MQLLVHIPDFRYTNDSLYLIYCIFFLFQPILFWGRTRENLNEMILIEPILGWEGREIKSYGNVAMSSLAVMQISHTKVIIICDAH